LFVTKVSRKAKAWAAMSVSNPRLFAMRAGSQFAASPDGQRFLSNTALEGASASPITIVLN
jgi:hypothetical protein